MHKFLSVLLNKPFIVISIVLGLFLLAVRVILPLCGAEAPEFEPIDFSVDSVGNCYIGRKENICVYKENVHIDTLVLPTQLKGYDSFVVLPEIILFRKGGAVWQATLELYNVQKCDNQSAAMEQFSTKKATERANYHLRRSPFLVSIKSVFSNKTMATTPSIDNVYRGALVILLLVVFIQTCRLIILANILTINGNKGRHPNWND